MASTLETLVVKLTADATRLEAELNKQVKSAQTAGQRINRAFMVGVKGLGAIGTAAIGAATALTTAANRAATYADNIDKAAIRTRLARTTVQELQFAADQAGGSFQTIEQNIRAFTGRIAEAERGSKTLEGTFDRLGVALRDSNGNLRDTESLFLDTLNALSKVGNETERAALAVSAFGETGTELLPIISQGAGGIDELRKRAHELGIVMDDQAVRTLVAYKDQMSRVQQQAGALGREVTTILLPALTEGLLPAIETGLRFFRDLPEPMQRAAAAATALGTGFTAAAAGARLLGIGLAPLLGPAGWILAAASAIGILAFALSGDGNSVDAAVERASKALAAGDVESLTGALGEVIKEVDGPVKTSLIGLQNELRETGDVGVDAAQRIGAALAEAVSAKVKAERFVIEAELTALRQARDELQVNAGLQPVGDLPKLQAELRQVQFDLQGEAADLSSADPERVRVLAQRESELQAEIGLLKAAADGTEGVSAALAEYNEQIAELERRLGGLPGAIPTPTPGGGGTTPPPGGAGDAPDGTPQDPIWVSLPVPWGPNAIAAMERAEVLGPGAGMATGGARPVPVQVVTDSRSTNAFQYGLDVLRRRGVVAAQENAARDVEEAATRRQMASIEALARIRYSLTSATERGAAAEEQLEAAREKAQEAANIAARGAALSTANLRAAEDAGTVGRGVILDDRAKAENERRMRAEAAAYESLARIRGSLNLATRQGIEAESALLDLRKRAGFMGGKPGSGFDGSWRERGSGGKFDGPLVKQGAEDLRQASEEFRANVVESSILFGTNLVNAFKSGDPSSIFGAVTGGIGSILGLFNPLAGEFFSLFGGLGSALIGLGRNEESEATRALGAATRGAPAIEFNVSVYQSLNIASLTGEGRRAVDGLLDDTASRIEAVITRNVLPRLGYLEERIA